ncbi:MAG: winged helix-turn-helix domain-containing protein [Desulfurococcales archaeon]|nr:winged helix-turn-helix domain-containing protein [Desulfurococcales archaeon]
MRKTVGLLVLLVIISLTSPILLTASASSPSFSYTYDCKNGLVYVIVSISGVTGLTNITIPEDQGTLEESIVAINQDGTPLPVLAGADSITIYISNDTRDIQVSYIMYPYVVENTNMIVINPLGQATVLLPINGSLVYSSDSPKIYANYSRIILTYSEQGIYTIYYTGGIIQGTTTTSNTTSTGVSSGTTSPTPSSSTVTSPTSTIGPGEHSTTSAYPTSPQQTGTTGHPKEWKGIYAYSILGVAILLIAIALAYYFKSRQRKGGSGGVQLDTGNLDDRDVTLLRLIEKGGHSISSLAKETGYSKSVVWRRIKKLEKMGLIEVSKGIGKTEIKITEKGRTFLTT